MNAPSQLTNQERVERVKVLWKQKTFAERKELLTVSFADGIEYAREVDLSIKSMSPAGMFHPKEQTNATSLLVLDFIASYN